MAVEIHIISHDGAGDELWHERVPWIAAAELQKRLPFRQVDLLTSLARTRPDTFLQVLRDCAINGQYSDHRVKMIEKIARSRIGYVDVFVGDW